MPENITTHEWGKLPVSLRLDVNIAVNRALDLLATELYGTLPSHADLLEHPPAAQRDHHLARLAAMELLTTELTHLTRETAFAAGRVEGAPATYADLGAAVGIGREGGRSRFPGAVPDAKPGRPRKQVTVTLSGGHPQWDGRELEYDRASVYDLDLDDVGALLMIEDGSYPDHLSMQEGVDWRAHYAPESEDTRTVWTFQGWVPA